MKSLYLSGLVAAAAAFAVPPSATAQSRVIKATKSADVSQTRVVVDGGTGVGVFQDIQVPINEEAGERGDGTVVQEENADHTGFPLYAGVSALYRPSEAWSFTLLGFDALQIRAATGPAATQSASYSRVDLGTAAHYSFPVGSLTGDAGVRAGVRRSSWSNISSSHYINAVLGGASLALRGESTGFELFGQTAPVASVGYSEAVFFGGREFKKAKATLSEAGTRLSFVLREGVWLDTGIEREMATIDIPDVNEYNSFGLNVLDNERSARSYVLSTTVVKFGFRKEF